MHFNAFAKLTAFAVLISHAGLTAAAPCETSPNFGPQATFVMSWLENGFTRYRYTFTGVQDQNDFVHAFQNCGGITNNWQCWTQDGHGIFDDSEVVGTAGANVISCGICAVTGQDCPGVEGARC